MWTPGCKQVPAGATLVSQWIQNIRVVGYKARVTSLQGNTTETRGFMCEHTK